MQYMGGKFRISTELANLLNIYIYIYEKPFVSLFCGACSIESKIKAKRKILNDKHEHLIEMLRAVQNGYSLFIKKG